MAPPGSLVVVLLPQREAGPGAIEALARALSLPPYDARIRLASVLPRVVLASPDAAQVARAADALDGAGIEFFVAPVEQLVGPLPQLEARTFRTDVGGITFIDRAGSSRLISPSQPLFLAEAFYEKALEATDAASINPLADAVRAAGEKVSRSQRIAHLYSGDDPTPVLVSEAETEFLGLGPMKTPSASQNLSLLLMKLREWPHAVADDRILRNRIAVGQSITDVSVGSGITGMERLRAFSNRTDVDFLSRALYVLGHLKPSRGNRRVHIPEWAAPAERAVVSASVNPHSGAMDIFAVERQAPPEDEIPVAMPVAEPVEPSPVEEIPVAPVVEAAMPEPPAVQVATLDDVRAAFSQNPGDLSLRVQLLEWLAQDGVWDEAEGLAQPMVADRAVPAAARARAALALSRAAGARGDKAAARKWGHKAVTEDPSFAEGHLALGRLYLEAGQAAMAENVLEDALSRKLAPAEIDKVKALLREAHGTVTTRRRESRKPSP